MDKKLQAIKIKQQRGLVIFNLGHFYPTPVRLDTLYRTVCMDETYDKELFRRDIHYLKQKGYIAFVDDKIGGLDSFDARVVILTETGKEIAEGTMTDPALEI